MDMMRCNEPRCLEVASMVNAFGLGIDERTNDRTKLVNAIPECIIHAHLSVVEFSSIVSCFSASTRSSR